jgi:DedD protein
MARREPADTSPTDPALPFKRRARRRLVGALVIGVGLAIALPLVLDREPRYPKPDIRVDIPPRDAPLPVRSQSESDGASAGPNRTANSADAARAARAEAGRAAEARSQGANVADPAQAAADARQQAREPMLQSLDAPAADPAGARPSAAQP